MDATLIPNAAIENPSTLREVGIHLGNLLKALDEIKSTEKQHHADNIARNDEILKKLDEMQIAYPTRAEFVEFKEVFNKQLESKADRWVQTALVWIGCAVGIAIIGALMNLILIRPAA